MILHKLNFTCGRLLNGCYDAKDAAVCSGVMQTGGRELYACNVSVGMDLGNTASSSF